MSHLCEGIFFLFEATHCVSPAGKYLADCAAFRLVSPNVEPEESGIKEDKEQSEEQTYTEVKMEGVRVREENVRV